MAENHESYVSMTETDAELESEYDHGTTDFGITE